MFLLELAHLNDAIIEKKLLVIKNRVFVLKLA